MALYMPLAGWDATVALAVAGDTVFTDGSEFFNVKFEEKYNPVRRKQLGTQSPGYLPGRYEASGSASAYFITSTLASKLYGTTSASARRDHAARGMVQFNLKINFSAKPIQVDDSPLLNLTGYLLSGCLLDTDSFEIEDGEYVEKPLQFQIQRVLDVYHTDVDADLDDYIV